MGLFQSGQRALPGLAHADPKAQRLVLTATLWHKIKIRQYVVGCSCSRRKSALGEGDLHPGSSATRAEIRVRSNAAPHASADAPTIKARFF
jgi:hypothetical protein